MTQPLEGILVIAIEQAVAAPLCTSRLCDAGARVIKIEREGGDFARKYDTAAQGESSYFTWNNQGKESAVLDFKSEDDKMLLQNMILQADVLVQNLAPGALGRAGLDPEQLRQQNTKLVTCDISGYGDSEELSDMKAYDLLVQAEAGLVEISGGPGELGRIGVSICDIGAGMSAHAGILEALLLRAKTGHGSSVKVSLFDVAAEWMSVPFMHEKYGAGAPERAGLHHPSIAPYGAYTTNDEIKTLVSIQNEREWPRFCAEVLHDEGLTTDPLFENNNLRVKNRKALDLAIAATLSTIDAEEFRRRLGNASIAYGAINSVRELIDHRALSQRSIANSEGVSLTVPATPLLASTGQSERQGNDSRRTPAVGEHTTNIRQEFG